MAVVAGVRIGAGSAEVEFTPNAQGVVTGIIVRNTLPEALRAVRVTVSHAGSGYSLDSEFVLGAPITINIPKPRQFPDDHSASVTLSTLVRTVA